MSSDMISSSEHDYIQSYELAIKHLDRSPDDKELQYQAVLSLAQTGALDFALAEYTRYGLDKVQNHEDIMSLAGRLAKDAYLKSSGKAAAQYAKESADKYEAAFLNTQGYYSGINAATMALMADMPSDTISERAQSIMDILLPAEKLTPTDHYFIEATRAESLLLKGNVSAAKIHLKAALSFDPLNYTAHATTIKQFKMILTKRSETLDWLSEFMPPRPMHYAGHINLSLSASEYDALPSLIADHIQRHDIGFGFGALAAGSDILIAEALLDEGAELHIVLPCTKDVFIEHSVQAFGQDWVSRHHACLERATSITIMAHNAPGPDARVNRLAGQLAMGQAVLRGQYFGVSAMQLLIWNAQKGASYTALHAKDWESTGREQIVIPIEYKQGCSKVSDKTPNASPFIMRHSNDDNISQYKTANDAMRAAMDVQFQSQNVRVALHVDIPNETSDTVLDKILQDGTPKSILMSEDFASLLALFENNQFDVSFAGLVGNDRDNQIRCYALEA